MKGDRCRFLHVQSAASLLDCSAVASAATSLRPSSPSSPIGIGPNTSVAPLPIVARVADDPASPAPAREVCRDNLKGRCKRGEQCAYAHPPSDTAASSKSAPLQTCQDDVKGRCTPGAHGPSTHDSPALSSAAPASSLSLTLSVASPSVLSPPFSSLSVSCSPLNAEPEEPAVDSPPTPNAQPKEVCWDFQRGKCYRGDYCRYAHERAPSAPPNEPPSSPVSAPPLTPCTPTLSSSSLSSASSAQSRETPDQTLESISTPEPIARAGSPSHSQSSDASDTTWWSALSTWNECLSEADSWSSPSSAGPSTPRMTHAPAVERVAVYGDALGPPKEVAQKATPVGTAPAFPPGLNIPSLHHSSLPSSSVHSSPRPLERTPQPVHNLPPRLADALPPRPLQAPLHPPVRSPTAWPCDKVCLGWLHNGRCNWGDNCKYPHVTSRVHAPEHTEKPNVEPMGFNPLDVCLAWIQGRCKHPFCKYRHPGSSPAAEVRPRTFSALRSIEKSSTLLRMLGQWFATTALGCPHKSTSVWTSCEGIAGMVGCAGGCTSRMPLAHSLRASRGTTFLSQRRLPSK